MAKEVELTQHSLAVQKEIESWHPDLQFKIATHIASNVGYFLVPEGEHPDSPHAPKNESDFQKSAVEIAQLASLLADKTYSYTVCIRSLQEQAEHYPSIAGENIRINGDIARLAAACRHLCSLSQIVMNHLVNNEDKESTAFKNLEYQIQLTLSMIEEMEVKPEKE